MTCTSLIGAAALLIFTPLCAGLAQAHEKAGTGPAHTIGSTVLIGTADIALWTGVLEVLPVRPARIVILSAGSLPAVARQRVRGLQAFVVQGSGTVFVLRDAASLRQAESGDAFDRLVLASVLFHEMSHARGLDEGAALEAEQRLWREFVVVAWTLRLRWPTSSGW